MFQVNKITQQYDPLQDRIRLNMQIQNGLCITVWITQRLLNSLVGPLAKWLDDEAVEDLGGKSVANFQAWKQTVAKTSMNEQPAVDVSDIIDLGLLLSVDLSREKKQHILIFKWQADGQARLVLTTLQLRQWLSVLARLVNNASWPKTNWPNWLVQPAKLK
jgi:hypothetical protein